MLNLCVLFLVLQVCFAALKKDCVIDGKHYKDGQQFNMGCTGRCTCSNGNHGCVSMCPPFGMGENCRKVKNVGECCQHGECFAEVSSKKCDSPGTPGFAKVKSPWSVEVDTGTRSRPKKCTATIMGHKTLITNDECVSPTDTVTFPGHPKWNVKSKKAFPFVPHVRQLIMQEPIEYSHDVHEINSPWGHFCNDNNCALYLSSFKNRNETEFVQAKRATKDKCHISNDDKMTACLEIPQATRPQCTHLDGSSVVVKKGPTFYIIGVLVDGHTGKDNHQCDTNRDQYRKYINMCAKLNEAQSSGTTFYE